MFDIDYGDRPGGARDPSGLDTRDLLLEYRVRTAYSGIVPIVAGNVVNAVVVAAVTFGHVAFQTTAAWLVAMVVVLIYRVTLCLLYARSRDRAARNKTWANLNLFGVVATGALWGIAGWEFTVPDVPHTQLITAVILAGMVAGALSTLRTLPFQFMAFAALAILPITVKFVYSGGFEFMLLGCATGLFFIIMSAQGFNISRQLELSEARRLRNAELVRSLEAEKVNAENASKAKSDFLANMSHELRTPMNAILGFAQMLEIDKRAPLSESQKGHVRGILNGGNHLLGLINEILDLARVEANQLELRMEPVSVPELVDECVSLTEPLSEPRGITVETRFGAAPPPLVRADRMRLKQALLNVISNAIKFNKERGAVAISTMVTKDGFLRVSIADTGIGIAEKHHAELFQMFHRIGSKSNVAREGTGIGLAVSKLLVERMSGRIGFESEPNVGSTFWIDLPRAA